MKIAIRLLTTVFALLLVAHLLPGVSIEGLYPAVIASILLGLLNLIARPILVILTLPITIVTLGLFIFVINALIFWFVASFVDGFTVTSFLSALIGSVIVSIVSTIAERFLNDRS